MKLRAHMMSVNPAIAWTLLVGGLALGCARPLPDLDDASRDLSAALPVFPGAEGFGTDTVAGRGGDVIRVTSLEADGPGSLAAALESTGPRTVVFEVGGVISLSDNLELTEPFVTIAGQTAPDPGITLHGAGLVVSTHDVLVQHLAIRPGGASEGPDAEVRDAIAVIGDRSGELAVYNVVIDHVSLTWGVDETFSTWYPGVRDITLSNSIIAESLNDSIHPEGEHSKALLIGDHTRRFSVLRNVLAHNIDRNPISKGDTTALFVNNLVHNPGRWPVTLGDGEGAGPSFLSVQSSVFLAGRDTPEDHATVLGLRSLKSGSAVHTDDLISWNDGKVEFVQSADAASIVDDAPVSVAPLTRLRASEVEASLRDAVGSRPWARSPIDARIIQDIDDRAGRVIDDETDVGGLGEIQATTRPVVLPDDPSGDADGDGYTNLEAWLHTQAR